MKIPMPRIFRAKPKFSRSFTRYNCQLDGSLMFIDRMISFEGRVIDMSRGGAMFRPKLAYIMQRRDVPVCMSVGDEEIFGLIVGTTPAGFSIRFDEPIEEETIISLIDRFDNSKKQAA